jgi:hypothetical protein
VTVLHRETVAYQAQLEHLRAARGRHDLDDRMKAELAEDLGRARRALEIAYFNHGLESDAA